MITKLRSFSILFLFIGLVKSLGTGVEWSCGTDEISVILRSETPFDGALMAFERPQTCRSIGNGTTVTELSISLQTRELCNVQYDELTGAYSVRVEVHSHPILVLDTDSFVDIICSPKTQENGASSTITPNKLRMLVTDNGSPTQSVIYGRRYTVEVRNEDVNDRRDMLISRCTASAASSENVTLSDWMGCPTAPSIMSPFRRDNIDKDSSTRFVSSIPSMFRFPSSDRITIRCAIRLCDIGDKCLKKCHSVATDKDDADLVEDEIQGLLGQVTTPMEEDFGEQEAGLYYLYTTITVLPSDSEEAFENLQHSIAPAPTCKYSESLLLVIAVVISGIMFVVGCLCNLLFFCLIRRSSKSKQTNGKSTEWMEDSRTGNNNIRTGNRSPDFWIPEAKTTPVEISPPPPMYDPINRFSGSSYASVKKNRRQTNPPQEYGVPNTRATLHQSQFSDYGGSSSEGGDPGWTSFSTPSTFLPHSMTIETELETSNTTNQTSSYH